MRCDKCKHWDTKDAETGWESGEIGFHQCLAVRERWVIQDAANNTQDHIDYDDEPAWKAWGERRKEALRASRAFVQDGSEYRAELVTGPDYFCALFEEN